ncbi:MAG: TatD family hydrolase [Verrucomicrobiae bacterium]|nr:TatD family hydrolase [Verrucomicrobiae bacterium]
MNLYDAHNHLQDERFEGRQDDLVRGCKAVGVRAMVVNGSSEADWPDVAALAQKDPGFVRPAFGYHPWHVHERSAGWGEDLRRFLRATPGAGIGEIGLDRWKPGLDFAAQQPVFQAQLALAAEHDVPASIHCLQAWGRLFDLLREGPVPRRGFLLHSYGGPVEMVGPLASLGAWFSFPGYFAHERKRRQRETFLQVPPDRLLIETDAPDQTLPPRLVRYPLPSNTPDRPLNHPANLGAVYEFVADLRGMPVEDLAVQVEANFLSLFGVPVSIPGS